MEQTDIFAAGAEAAADDVKNRIKALWLGTGIAGVSALVDWLEETDFFIAPCSRNNHLAVPGGLALHSLHVSKLLAEKIAQYKLNLGPRSAIVCGLGHDLCKINYYVEGQRWRKDEAGRWESYRTYEIEDKEPLGHGEKSVMILQRFIEIEREEALAIRWHMGGFDSSVQTYAGERTFSAAQKVTPLVTLLQTADLEATHLLEAEGVER